MRKQKGREDDDDDGDVGRGDEKIVYNLTKIY